MKKSHLTRLSCLLFMILAAFNSFGQLSQYAIGSSGNELATKVKTINDGQVQATVIAGYSYTYDSVSSVVSNCQAIIMKVYNGGAIAWQKTFGLPGTNNLIQDLIITADGNIVVVGKVGGTGSVYADNTAAILKFNINDGSLMWQSCLRDGTTTTGGEIFYGVTELNDGTHRLVAVGIHDLTPSGAGGMICVFQPDGTFIYGEVLDVPDGDDFYKVATSAAGNSVYICGVVVGNYKDGRVVSYTPGTTNGTVNWSQYFDFGLEGTLWNNYLTNIYVSGSKLVIAGSCTGTYSTSSNMGQFVMTMNAADGSSALITSITDNGTSYSNMPCIAVQDSDHIYAIQSPSTSFYDASSWLSGVSTSTVINDITSVSSRTANTPVQFTSTEAGQHSFLDMQYVSGYLYLAGATNIPSGYGNNDIYYVVTGTGLASLNHDCDTAHEAINLATCSFTNPTPSYSPFTFTPIFSTVDTATTTFGMRLLCGDVAMPTRVMNKSAARLAIYPNPATNTFTIQAGEVINSLKIYNVYGQKVFESPYYDNEVIVNVSNLPQGLYIVNVNNIMIEKVVIE